MAKKYLKLEDITAYNIASELSDYVWEVVSAKRKLLTNTQNDKIMTELRKLPKEINSLIRYLHRNKINHLTMKPLNHTNRIYSGAVGELKPTTLGVYSLCSSPFITQSPEQLR